MAKITINEAVHISTVIDGEIIDLDLTPGDIDLHDVIADLLITQGHASPAGKTSKKTSSAAPVEETPIPAENPEA